MKARVPLDDVRREDEVEVRRVDVRVRHDGPLGEDGERRRQARLSGPALPAHDDDLFHPLLLSPGVSRTSPPPAGTK